MPLDVRVGVVRLELQSKSQSPRPSLAPPSPVFSIGDLIAEERSRDCCRYTWQNG
jgi:hypothetical protein